MVERVLSLEVQHRVDDVLERLRPGDAAALRDVADDEHGRAALLREAHQPRGAFAHLSDVARRALEVGREHGLNRIDDERRGRRRRRCREDRFEIRLAQERDVAGVSAEPVGAQANLERGFFAGRVEHRPSGLLEARRDLEQQRRLADARFAPDENHRARDDPAAEHEVEFVEASLPAVRLRPLDVAQPRRDRDAAAFGESSRACGPPRAHRARRDPRRRRSLRRACSTRRTCRSGPATSSARRRTRCSGRPSSLSPYLEA